MVMVLYIPAGEIVITVLNMGIACGKKRERDSCMTGRNSTRLAVA